MGRKITNRQFIQEMFKKQFKNYNEEDFIKFFEKVMNQVNDHGYSLAQAFYYCAIDKLNEEAEEILREIYETKD